MVKRASHIVLVLLLLVSTSGITISKHYCGGNLRAVTIMTTPDPCCDTEGCCHNDTEVYQVSDDYSITFLYIDFEQEVVPVPVLLAYNSSELIRPDVKNIYTESHSPPGVRLSLSTIQTFRL